ncbi:MAG TPA: hypothetical protein VFH92_07390, partial [Phenylobacterium sp.]|nr:hypothetical protein [Phenylobacterium sp.]
ERAQVERHVRSRMSEGLALGGYAIGALAMGAIAWRAARVLAAMRVKGLPIRSRPGPLMVFAAAWFGVLTALCIFSAIRILTR